MKPKISLITLGVGDFARSFHFYRVGLGFTPHGYTESSDYVTFEMEGTWLSLYPREKLAEVASIPSDGAGFSGITLAHNVASRQEVDYVYAMAVAAGGKPVKPPQEVFWGGYSSYFADPDGYLWEVAYNPFTDLT